MYSLMNGWVSLNKCSFESTMQCFGTFWEKRKKQSWKKVRGIVIKVNNKSLLLISHQVAGTATRFFKWRREFHSSIWFLIQNAIINNILVNDADFSKVRKRIQKIKYIYRYLNSITHRTSSRICKIWSRNLVFFIAKRPPKMIKTAW